MRTVTLGQAAAELNVTRRTLAKWLKRLQIAPSRHHADTRFWTLTDEQVEQIRAARAEMPQAAPALPRLARPALLPPALSPLLPAPLPRPAALSSLSREIHEPRPGDTFPVGWIAVSTFARTHGLRSQERSLPQLWALGRFPAPQTSEEGWLHRGLTIKSAFTQEQHLEASRLASARWPGHFVACEVCGPALLTDDTDDAPTTPA